MIGVRERVKKGLWSRQKAIRWCNRIAKEQPVNALKMDNLKRWIRSTTSRKKNS